MVNKFRTKEPPKGRQLTEQEEESIVDWTTSRKAMFRLVKAYGDMSLIPEEELKKIHELALSELTVAVKQDIAVIEAPVVRKDPIEYVAFEPLDTNDLQNLYRGNPNLDYEALWDAYPKRHNPEDGHKWGIAFAKHRARTKEQYQEMLRIIKAVAFYNRKQYGADLPKYTLKFDNFIKKIEDHQALSLTEVKRIKSRQQRPFVRPNRPALPWETDPRLVFTVTEKQRIMQGLKETENYDDQTNDKYWYDL